MKYDLVFEGGGAKGMAFVGAYEELAERGHTCGRLLGTSAGAITAAFIAAGYVPAEMLAALNERELHRIDPGPLARSLKEQGFDESAYRFGSGLELLREAREAAVRYPWLGAGLDWLVEHRPPEPERLSVCHGDFHPLNILVQDGQVTGVVDWGGLKIADPVLDIANTIVLAMIPAKHLFSLPGWDKFPGMYLDAYRAHRPLDLGYLDYYQARRCIIALMEGARGHQVWHMPAVVEALVDWVHSTTGIRVTPPGQG
jgi:hypothetical protein